jgi:IS30 family transposase
MKREFNHFNFRTRQWLHFMLVKGVSRKEISANLGMWPSSITREINRNSIEKDGKRIYDPLEAQLCSDSRQVKVTKSKILRSEKLLRIIEKKLRAGWGPDVISGYLKRNRPSLYVCHETIYMFIYQQKREWIKLLARGRDRRAHRKNRYESRKKGKIPNRVSIEQRPTIIDSRKTFGHFEVDCIVSKKSKAALLVVCERKTNWVRIYPLSRKTAREVKRGLVYLLKDYSKAVRTLTYDNGTENVLHMLVNKKLNCESYFCNPYHSWEKGTVENTNGLIRRYVKKGIDIALFSKKQIKIIEKRLNTTPRKKLDYFSPQEYFNQEWRNCA